MESNTLVPGDAADPVAPPPAAPDRRTARFFDLAGWLWMLGCVLFATTAGRLLPQLAEPGGWHTAWLALAAQTTPVAQAETPPPRAQPVAPTQATAGVREGPELDALTPVVLLRIYQ